MRAVVARRSVAGLGVALALTVGVSACGGGGVDKSKLANKLKSEQQYKEFNGSQRDCIADKMAKYAKTSDLKDYLANKKSLSSVRGNGNTNDTISAVQDCVTKKK